MGKIAAKLLAGSGAIARDICEEPADGREVLHAEFVVADGNAACHGDRRKRADELQEGVRGIGSASKEASSEAAERLRVEAETADRKHRSALLNKRTAKMVIQGGRQRCFAHWRLLARARRDVQVRIALAPEIQIGAENAKNHEGRTADLDPAPTGTSVCLIFPGSCREREVLDCRVVWLRSR